MLINLSLPCQLRCSHQYVSGDKGSWLVCLLIDGTKNHTKCMVGPWVEVTNAQSGKELSYSSPSHCTDDQDKS